MPRTERFELRLSDDDVEALDKLASTWGCSRSEAARRAIREYARTKLPTQSVRTTSVQAKNAVDLSGDGVRTTSVQAIDTSASTNAKNADKGTSEKAWNEAPHHRPPDTTYDDGMARFNAGCEPASEADLAMMGLKRR